MPSSAQAAVADEPDSAQSSRPKPRQPLTADDPARADLAETTLLRAHISAALSIDSRRPGQASLPMDL